MPGSENRSGKKYNTVQLGSELPSNTNHTPTTFQIRYGKLLLSLLQELHMEETHTMSMGTTEDVIFYSTNALHSSPSPPPTHYPSYNKNCMDLLLFKCQMYNNTAYCNHYGTYFSSRRLVKCCAAVENACIPPSPMLLPDMLAEGVNRIMKIRKYR